VPRPTRRRVDALQEHLHAVHGRRLADEPERLADRRVEVVGAVSVEEAQRFGDRRQQPVS
jgi:hypothetical protein